MVQQAQTWPWSSLGDSAGSDGVKIQLAGWPVSRRPVWEQQVHELAAARTLERDHIFGQVGRFLWKRQDVMVDCLSTCGQWVLGAGTVFSFRFHRKRATYPAF